MSERIKEVKLFKSPTYISNSQPNLSHSYLMQWYIWNVFPWFTQECPDFYFNLTFKSLESNFSKCMFENNDCLITLVYKNNEKSSMKFLCYSVLQSCFYKKLTWIAHPPQKLLKPNQHFILDRNQNYSTKKYFNFHYFEKLFG